MGKPDKAAKENKGQSKEHEVNDAQGNPVEGGMTQEQWKGRDKTAGYTRPEDDENLTEPPPNEEPVVPAG